jgi:hypothetical protein
VQQFAHAARTSTIQLAPDSVFNFFITLKMFQKVFELFDRQFLCRDEFDDVAELTLENL